MAMKMLKKDWKTLGQYANRENGKADFVAEKAL